MKGQFSCFPKASANFKECIIQGANIFFLQQALNFPIFYPQNKNKLAKLKNETNQKQSIRDESILSRR